MDQWISKNSEPLDVFKDWFEQAQDANSFEPTAMTLATVDSSGMPSARVVLLKDYSKEGFCFFTNYESVKSIEIGKNPKAALVFHWEKPFHRQIRVRGEVEKLSAEKSNTYFQTRNRGSQIGAWSSPQSQEISDRSQLEKWVKQNEDRFVGQSVPCPEFWGGFILHPLSIEFWQAGEHRLHDRMKFTRSSLGASWSSQRLAP